MTNFAHIHCVAGARSEPRMHSRNTGSRLVPEGQVATGIKRATASAARMNSTESPQIHRLDPSGVDRPAPYGPGDPQAGADRGERDQRDEPGGSRPVLARGPFRAGEFVPRRRDERDPRNDDAAGRDEAGDPAAGDISARMAHRSICDGRNAGSSPGVVLPTTLPRVSAHWVLACARGATKGASMESAKLSYAGSPGRSRGSSDCWVRYPSGTRSPWPGHPDHQGHERRQRQARPGDVGRAVRVLGGLRADRRRPDPSLHGGADDRHRRRPDAGCGLGPHARRWRQRRDWACGSPAWPACSASAQAC